MCNDPDLFSGLTNISDEHNDTQSDSTECESTPQKEASDSVQTIIDTANVRTQECSDNMDVDDSNDLPCIENDDEHVQMIHLGC